jgi:2-polyprenyl-3-methyl-5-hydroxy-6-metoxy-1,4-benzoquinol methylase
MELKSLELFTTLFLKEAAIFKKTFWDVQAEFGDPWRAEFDIHLLKLFALDEAAYRNAIRGYGKFAIDAMRLQRRFNQTLKYEDVSYEEACARVYLNEEYMRTLYLPGIFVSHFLWRHHYRHFLYHKERFLPLLDANSDKRFYEVGTGTGFYTVQALRHHPRAYGYGIDISPSSRHFTRQHVERWGYDDRLSTLDVDILEATLEPLPCIQSVEVLEHLRDPRAFLRSLRTLLAPGGFGFITAAITAPEADHIYLYWTADDVIEQMQDAGFTVNDYLEERAYQGAPGEQVPRVAAFIVS